MLWWSMTNVIWRAPARMAGFAKFGLVGVAYGRVCLAWACLGWAGMVRVVVAVNGRMA